MHPIRRFHLDTPDHSLPGATLTSGITLLDHVDDGPSLRIWASTDALLADHPGASIAWYDEVTE